MVLGTQVLKVNFYDIKTERGRNGVVTSKDFVCY